MAEAQRAAPFERDDVAQHLPPRDEIAAVHLKPEASLVDELIERVAFTQPERDQIAETGLQLAKAARSGRVNGGGVDALMHEYGLTNEEGVILMCLAEALLRIPDRDTADALIADKIGEGHWAQHLGQSNSIFVNASTWGLMLTGRVLKLRDVDGSDPLHPLKRIVARSGEPVIRRALRHAVKMMANQFVLGRDIDEALVRGEAYEAAGYALSYDMLGEAAYTDADADRYFETYMTAIEAIGRKAGILANKHSSALMARPGLSVKLSAIHPRFEPGKEKRLRAQLLPRLIEMAGAARDLGLLLTIDAEEQDKLDLTLGLFGEVFADPLLADWDGLGLAVQAYGKRALPVLRWLKALALQMGKRIPVRLVKGAYWDSEIKWAQTAGLADYPVFTRKEHTDVSYLAAMRLLLAESRVFYPQLASHNAHTVAAGHVAADQLPVEFQRLHGMGAPLYDEVLDRTKLNRAARIYAPVGTHESLLPYLVRRLLENGANASFVNRAADDAAPIAQLIRDPVEIVSDARERAADEALADDAASGHSTGHADANAASTRTAGVRSAIPNPRDIYLPERLSAKAVALSEATIRLDLLAQVKTALGEPYHVGPIIAGEESAGGPDATLVSCPHDRDQRLGTVVASAAGQVEQALGIATSAADSWDQMGGAARADILDQAATMMERDWARLCAVIVREAGKTLDNAQSDIREAVDFLRYYANGARRQFGEPAILPGPTGEQNMLSLHGRGVFACIAPWNFPLAIFTGQIAAALAAGNSVIAKPAGQTPVIASLAVQLLLKAGVPADVLQFLPGGGDVGAMLVKDRRIKGIAFTGSTHTAFKIQAVLAKRGGPMIPFIAETGGLNAMIADSSSLPEQVVRDAVRSAFDSAGQRCSAARVLFLQDEIADKTVEMLVGATQALDIGDPLDYATDVGPVIDQAAQDELEGYKFTMREKARKLVELELPDECGVGSYVTPTIYEIDRLDSLEGEVFGPILHVIRYSAGHLIDVCKAIRVSQFGLTLGLHSRISGVADFVAEHAHVGNLYVNRDQIGAVVGAQPFGGEGLSGTGPKAGGPHTLISYAHERVRSTDITATGGNAQLLGMPLTDDA